MTLPAALWLLIPGAYLLGALPQVYLLGRLAGRDLRPEGDLHQALWRASRTLGVAGVLGDMAKGSIPVLAARLLGAEMWLMGAAGVAVVVGQMWPVFLPTTGGKGNSIGLPMALALSPGPFLVAAVPIVVSVAIRMLSRLSTRQSPMAGPPSYSLPLGMLTGFTLLPLAAYAMGEAGAAVLAFLALWLLILLRRLTAGLRADLRVAPHKGRVILNRLLYDRSFLQSTPEKTG